jgi:c-di-GMP-binding flagellar brake protein YcgR
MEGLPPFWLWIVGSMTSEENIFTPVLNRGERERIFSRLTHERKKFSFQAKKNLYVGRVVRRDKNDLIFESESTFQSKAPIEVTVSFSLGSELYFMKTIVVQARDHVHLKIDKTIFKLQRRDSFRLVIPARYRSTFELRSVDLQSLRKGYSVVNLSGGGLNIEILEANELLQVGCHVTGMLIVGEYFIRPIVGTIKHMRALGSMGSGVLRAGIQFEGLSRADREQIVEFVMKIHRESFSKFKIS